MGLESLYRVTEVIRKALPHDREYPLLPGDIIVREGIGWMKIRPGEKVYGFILTEDQIDRLSPVRDTTRVERDGEVVGWESSPS